MQAVDYYNSRLAISAAFLFDNKIVTESNYRQLAHRGILSVIRRGCRNTPALVDYENMPETLKMAVRKIIPNPMAATQRNAVEDLIEHNAAYSDFYDNYKLEDGRNLPRSNRLEYYNNAIVLDGIGRLYAAKKAVKRNFKVKQFWAWAAELTAETDRSKFSHSLPAHPLRLRQKFEEFSNGEERNLASLISSKFGTKNAAKVKEGIQEGILFKLLTNNVDDVLVTNLYNFKGEQEGWAEITSRTAGIWRAKWEMELHAARHGETSFYNKIAMQNKRSKPSYPFYFWSMDGWDVELLYQKTEMNKNGRLITTLDRVTIVIVLDTCVNYPIGYAIGRRENSELIKEALKNAVNHSRELFGQRYSTQQLQSDHFGRKGIKQVAEAGFAKHFTPAKSRNAKAKPIEPYNLYLNKNYCRMFANWSGYGVQSKKESQPNSELLNINKKSFPDYDGLIRQIDMIMAMDRGKKLEAYRALFEQMPQEKQLPMTDENYLMIFGTNNGHKQLLQHNGLNITIVDAYNMTGNGIINIQLRWRRISEHYVRIEGFLRVNGGVPVVRIEMPGSFPHTFSSNQSVFVSINWLNKDGSKASFSNAAYRTYPSNYPKSILVDVYGVGRDDADFIGQLQFANDFKIELSKACPSFDVPKWAKEIGIKENQIYRG